MRRFGSGVRASERRRGDWQGGGDRDERQRPKRRRSLIESLEERVLLANQPDLLITAAAAPATAVEGNAAQISITWTVKNQGTAATSGSWSDAVYLSSSGALDSGSFRIDTLEESFQGPLASGASYSVTRVLTVPGAASGAQFLVVQTDDGQTLDESDTANNLYSLPITLSAPDVDLTVAGATAPASSVAGNGNMIAVSWTVKNQGTAAAKGNSTDAIYLSDTPTFDPQTAHFLDSRNADDQLPLAAGASYTVSRSIALGDIPPGSHYLFFSANNTGDQGELDQGAPTNNLFSLPITISSPGNIDLAVTDATAPAAAVAGNGQAINVSYTVKNQGTTAAASDWSDAIYLSSQPAYDSSAIPLSYYSGASQAPLAADASYTVTQSIMLPPHVAGAAYLLFRADRYDDQSETSKANNVFAVPITLSAPNVDLTVTSAATPATAEVGNQWQIAVDYTAKNQGSGTASGNWTDAIYVSSQPNFDSSATLLDTLYSGSDVPSSLPAGASYSVHDVVTIPNTAAGARYLLVRTNVGAGSSSSQAETNAANNVFSLPITLTAPAADLVISNPTAPATVEAGNGQSITVSWKVTNQGSAAADSYWYDNVLVGDDGNFDRNATRLFGYSGNYTSQLPAGASYVVTKSLAAPNVAPGTRQLVFVTDTGDSQSETQNSNNLVALPITFTQADVDLTVTNATAPAAAVAGAAIVVGWSVKNQGGETAAGDWSGAVYLSDVPTYDGNAVFIDSLDGPASLAAGGTYSPSQIVTLPGSISGNKYLLFVTNQGRTQGETNYANDMYAVPIALSSPDLKTTALTGPSSGILGDKITVSWTVTNQGSVTAPGGWSDAIYLSDTPGGNPFGSGDTYVGSFSHNAALAPGASYTQQQTLTLPASAIGNRYLVVVANAYGNVGDADPANNRFAVPITLTAPDLTVTAATAPASGVENDSIQVSWTVKNQGAVKAAGAWYDYVYVSSRPAYDGTATYVGSFNESARAGLAAGASYMETQSVTLPAFAVGAQYLLFVTNQFNYQPESDSPGGYSGVAANNVIAVPITLSAPDLAVTAATAPASAVIGNGVSIPISYTVKNQGSVPADGSWNDTLYLSDRPVYDSTATYVTSLGYRSEPLAAGASYSGVANVTVPNMAVGARYLLVVTNPYHGQGESDAAGSLGANNVYAMPITFTAPNVDLTVTGATAPPSAIAGDTLPVSFTVKNQGSDAAGANWTDQVYFSKSAIWDSSAVSVGGFSAAQRPLLAGASYVQNQSVTLSNVPLGAGYLLFVANGSNDQSETDGTNNVFAVPISVSAPDLAVTAASGPAAAIVGDNQQLAVSYTVQNVGSVPAHSIWYDALYISDKPTFDNTATFLANLEQNPPALGPGASYSDNFNVPLPTVAAGARYLLFVANAGQGSYYSSQPEADGQNGPGANNVFAVPITLTAPDVNLSVSNASAPAAVVSGDQVSVSFKVTNQGSDDAAANWTDGVYFSTSATFDKNQATLLKSFPAVQSPLAGGAHYDVSQTISIPDLALGAGFLFFVADIDGDQAETGDGTGNVVSLPVTVGAPDLAVTAASAPGSANTGDSISVSWTIANQGGVPAPAGWTDVIYLSTKPTFDSSARFLASFGEGAHAGLAAGDSYSDSQNMTISTSGLVGSLYLLVVTNAYGDQPETDGNGYYSPGANNVYALPITIGAPDLTITTATAPASAVVGNDSSIAVSYTVANQGAVDANGTWSDYLYVSDKPTYDSSAEYVTSLRYNFSSLAAGSTYTQNSNVTLPATASGARYLLFVTNAYRSISESDAVGNVDANDVYALPITLSAPDVDLAPSSPNAPASATIGQSIAVSFTVTNSGGEVATAGWSDVVYYSTKPTYDSSAVSVGYFYPSQVPLGAGASYTDSGNVTLSSSLPIGAGYLLFVVDANGDQGESDKTNNIVSLPITLAAADLAATAVTAPSSAAFDSSISVSWTVTNQGSAAASGNWIDAVYISSQPYWQYGATQIAAFNESSHSGLAPGANYTDTRNITIPSYLRSGDVYLIVRSDAYSSTGDTNRQNNFFATPIHLSPSAADLTVSSATAPATGVLGGSIAVSWTVTNQGTKDASSNWTDAVYLSSKPTYDNTAVFLDNLYAPPAASSPLTPGASYTLNDNLYLSGSATGAMYLLFVTNSNHNQSESDETNDVYALPITIAAPDLTVSTASAPAAAALGQTISVSWTTANSGGAATPAIWYDAVYVSSKNTFDNTATLVESFYEGAHAGMAEGGSYSETQDITLPATGLGQRYLLFVGDAFHDQPETDEANNVYAVPITLTAPDLTVTGAAAPTAADLGTPISVTWTVQNSSAVAAPASWHDAVYVSSIPTLDGTATLVAQFDESAQAGLAAGVSYTDSQSIVLPSTAIGQRYLLFVTDKDQGQPETNTANDVYALPITLSGADLTVAVATAPAIAAIGSTIDLSWMVKNQGNAAAQANWTDGIYLSNSNVLDGSAVYVGNFPASAAPLAAGASYTLNQSVLIPNTAIGSRFLLIVADSGQQQAESSEFNNVLALPIQLAQVDLAASSVSAPAGANFGDPINVSWTATNAGSTSINQPWSDRIYLSSSSTFDVNTATLLGTFSESAQAPLGPGDSYSQTAQVTLPLNATTTPGSYYVFVVVDGLNQASETNETNNAASQAVTIGLPALPDLVPTNLVVPASGLTGQGFNVSWTDQNNGTATATGPWQDYVWISTSNTLDGNARFLGQFTYSGALDPGQSVTRSQHFNLPGAAGQYYIIVRADADGAINEGPNAAHSTATSATAIDVQSIPLPDLVVSAITPPADGVLSGATVPVTYTVTNNGNAPTQAPLWYDAVFISQTPDLALTGNDFADGFNIMVQPLGVPVFAENPSYLAPGESYSQTVNVPLPVSAAGPWYVYVVTNRSFTHTPLDNFIDTGAVRESDSINDLTRSAAFNVTLAPTPDVALTRVQAPTQAFSGQTMNLSWTVTNQGPGIAIGQPLHVGFAPTQPNVPATPAQSTWQESVYLSTTQSIDASAVLLQTFTHNGALGPGDSFTETESVKLPVGISGQYYLIVQQDPSKQVFEAGLTANNVLSASATTNVNLTPPPDLRVEAFSAPAASLASHSLAINYQVTNAGSTATPENNWTDSVYLATGPSLDVSTDLKLGDITHQGVLNPGASYLQAANFTLPDGLSGTFHVFVVTDSGNLVFELDKANNVLSAGNATVVSSKPADLIVTAASAPAAANPGQVIPVSWTVTNQGAGDTAVTQWTDKVYATTEAALGVNRVLIASFAHHHGLLPSGASYTETELVTIPYTLTGVYKLFVETDAPVTAAEDGQGVQATGPGGIVYEGANEDNNVSTALPLLISTQLADLTVSQLQLVSPATLATGGSATVSWTVQNSGTAATGSTHWYDDVYLSPTPTFDAQTAVFLGSAFHNNPLAAGAQYSATATFTVPPNMAAGTDYLIVRADRPSRPPNTDPKYVNLVVESSETDNDGASATVTVDLGPTPDLTTAVTAPLSALSGQTIHVDWTVTNNGASSLAVNAHWYDTAYLSLDRTFDPNTDIPLGNVVRLTGLAAGANYTAGGDFRLPSGLAGLYYVIVVADAGASVYERGISADRIGLSDQPLDVSLQPPLDLVAGTITIPASAVPGQPITVTYSVTNNSAKAYAGDWYDSLYLSPTNEWQLANPLLGRVHHTSGVAAHGTYSETLTAPLPGVSPGTYYVILRTDIRNQVPETNETNNLRASAQTSLDVPAIVAGTPGTPVAGSLAQGGCAYYKVTVDAGQTLQFTLDAAQTNDVNGLYVSFGQMPSPSQADFHGDQALGASQAITIPSTQAGTYFIQIISRTVYGYNPQANPTAVADYSLTASIIPFSVSAVSPGQVGNAGSSTLKIGGAKFDRNTTFQLIDAQQNVIAASAVYVTDGATAYATFDLGGKPAGLYSIQATASDGVTRTMAADALMISAGAGAALDGSVDGPKIVLVNREQAFNVVYGNSGDADLGAPLISIISPFGNPMSALPGGEGAGQIVFLATSPDGPAGILRPGAQASLPIYFKSGTPADPYGFQVEAITSASAVPIDWNVVSTRWIPSTAASLPNWSDIYVQLKQQVGPTWGDFVQMLDRNAELLTAVQAGNPVNELEIEIQKAEAAISTSISGKVNAADLSIPFDNQYVDATNQTTGQVYAATIYHDGSFFFSNLAPGEYKFSVGFAIVASGGAATISAGQSMQDWRLVLNRGVDISGAALSSGANLPIPYASIRAVAGDSAAYDAFADARGNYVLRGLPAGSYEIIADAAGMARIVLSDVAVADLDLRVDLSFSPEATISGTIGIPANDLGHVRVTVAPTGNVDVNRVFATTTASSMFAVHGLPAGSYDVTLSADGYLPTTIGSVPVAAGASVTLGNIQMDKAASIAGVLVSENQNIAVSGVAVEVLQGDAPVTLVQSDSSGAFAVTGLAAGAYTLRALPGTGIAADQALTVTAGQALTGVSLAIAPGGVIRGILTDSQTGGAVAGFPVGLLTPDGAALIANTDGSGAYEFDQLPLGDYTVYLPFAAAAAPQTVVVSSLTGAPIIEDFSVSQTFHTQITGRVLTAGGAALSGAGVTLFDGGVAVATATTATDGTYRFWIANGGTFDVHVSSPDAGIAPLAGLTVADGEQFQQDFVSGDATLLISLNDDASDVAGDVVRLYLQTPSGNVLAGSQLADALGQVTFSNLAPGQYSVMAQGEGRGGEATVNVSAGSSGAASVTLSAQYEISGVATDSSLQPIANARVTLFSASGAANSLTLFTDANGAYVFSNVPGGTYDVVVVADGFETMVQPGVSVAGDAVLNATLMASASSLSGLVVDQDGHAVVGASVVILDVAGRLLGQAASLADGSFVITSVVGSNLTVQVNGPGGRSAQVQNVSVNAGESVDLGQIAAAATAIAQQQGSAATGAPSGMATPFSPQPQSPLGIPGFPPVPTIRFTGSVLTDYLLQELPAILQALKELGPPQPPDPKCPGCEALYAQAVAKQQAANSLLDNLVIPVGQQLIQDGGHLLGTLTLETAKAAGSAAALALGIALLPEFYALLTGAGLTGGLAATEAAEVYTSSRLIATWLSVLRGGVDAFNELSHDKLSGDAQRDALTVARDGSNVGKTAAGIISLLYGMYSVPSNVPQTFGVIVSAFRLFTKWPWENSGNEYVSVAKTLEQFEKSFKLWERRVEEAQKARDRYEKCLASQSEDCNKLVPPFDIPLPSPWHGLFPDVYHFPGIPRFPFDPNDIIGPEGYGDQHFIPADQPLAYEIEYENESAATAPAQEVTITEQLDPNIDPRSFRLGDFGWGGMRFSPPPDSAFYQTTIDETDTLGILVQVTATIDVSTGTAVWNFLSIDPATGEKPLDGGKGFLPPDDGDGSGQGFVSYTVLPDASVQTGDVIYAQATVFFDANAPIDTRTIFNTIDAGDSLGSRIAALPPHESAPQFTLSWAPTDQDSNGSAVASYSIYVSDNGGPFLPFLLDTTAAEALFTGQLGHTYAFYSLATDNAGNQQSLASAVQVSTTVGDAVQSSSGTTISPVEGQSFSGAVATFTGTDPNGQGTDFTAMIDWGDGSSLTAGTISGSAAAGYTVSGSHVYLEEGANLPLKAIVADQTNQQTTVSGLANVADAPITAAAVTFTATEGLAFSGTVATFVDANPNGELGDYTAFIDWGDGTPTTAGTIAVNPGGGFLVASSHVYADEGGYPVIVAIADAGGANDTAASSANVADAPLNAAAVSISATEGAAFSGTVATFVDANPNGDVGDFTALIDWGDGTTTTAGAIAVNPGGGFVVTGSHFYAEEGTRSVTVTISDVGGSTATAHSTAQIADAPLTAFGMTISATEGAAFSGAVATFTDANPNGEVGDYTAVIHWGDGSSSAGTIAAGANGFTVSGSHAYAEESAVLPLSVVISDVGGAKATATGEARVADAPLHITAASVSIPSGGVADHVLLATFTDTGGAEPVGHYTAVIDWGDGSPSDAGAIEFSGGEFQIFGSHSYTSVGTFTIGVTVEDEGGATDGLTEQASIELTARQKYVIAVYHDVLARAPDPGGLAYWSQLLDHGAAVSSVAQAIAHSDEYYANFVIKPDYVKLLGREADGDGVKYWTDLMRKGLTDQHLEAMLVSSNEFYANAGGTNLAWIDAIYNLLLGRSADSSGETYWLGQLDAGQSRQQVAERIANSAENDTQLINEDYFHYLGRDADPDGLAYWLAQFAAGKTNEDIIAGFTGSDEYYEQHSN